VPHAAPNFHAMTIPELEIALARAKTRGGEHGDDIGARDEAIGLAIEIELQRRALDESKRELERSRDRYARLYDLSPIGYLALDRRGVVREANVTAATILETDRARLPGWPLLAFVDPGSRRRLLEHLHLCNRDGHASGEIGLKTRRGTLTVQIESRVVPSSASDPDVLTAIIDVTARNRDESAARIARGELERRVKARTAELEEINRRLVDSVARAEQLEQALRRKMDDMARDDRKKDEFLAMLAHELRNPLAPIQAAAEVLRLAGGEAERVAWARKAIERQVAHLRRLVDDLLDLSRITLGKFQIATEAMDLAAVVDRALELAGPLIESRRHRLVRRTAGEPIVVRGDRERLTQVIANLLNNAAKYTPDGGEITVETGAHDGLVTVRVGDNGEGIEPELLQRVFDPFEQGDRSLARAGGLGIGLTLVKRIAELHGGTVAAQSAGLGKGATFTLQLPRGADAVETAPAVAADAVFGPSRKVLLVDDNVDALETLATLLRLEGHEIRTAQDAQHAVAEAVDFEPDVALLDIGLPGVDGYELAGRLRSLPQTRNALLVAVTGYGRGEDFARSGAAGFDHHLVKPVDPSRLNALIASARG
jgi:signal transduction histidine kinase/CheY-like chemotaxis protein